ncbi:uncharacterized protein [Littorina saxatilis]|uniref:uncharacterized protein n=1 Tax=Littorina saxatilis TaxID=31220 RepID=UPI0038B4FD09
MAGQHDLAMCKQRVQQWYPELSTQSYFVPAVYMNRTQHDEEEVAGRTVYVLQPLSQESDARDDAANNRVLRCLHQVSRGQAMFVISQLQFNEYLKHLSCTQKPIPPKPKDSILKKQQKHEGDFDILIIHRKYGIVACELKAFGDSVSMADKSVVHQQITIAEKVQQAVTQMQKARDVLQHLVSHDQNTPRIRTTLMMPNITRDQLRTALGANLKLKKDLRDCLLVSPTTDPTTLCLTQDDVSNPAQWWRECAERDGPDPSMTDDTYVDLVSRFGGPATTVTVPCSAVPGLAQAQCCDLRLPGEGVAETANRFAPADIILHPTQLDVLNNKLSPLVFVCGPPGTGKSLVLILRAIDWIQNKRKPVHVVSTREGNMAASHMIAHQLREMAKQADKHLIYLHMYDLPMELNKALRELSQSENPKTNQKPVPDKVFVIVDEACDDYTDKSETYFAEFCTKLSQRVGPGLHLWAASMYHNLRPPLLAGAVLRTGLRAPPSVTRHVAQHRALGKGKNVQGYEVSSTPLPADGPPVREVTHRGDGHDPQQETYECEACGKEVARTLDTLHVGNTDLLEGRNLQPPRYRDVLVLSWDSFFRDEEDDASGNVTNRASGFVRGLRDEGIPVTVLETGDADRVKDVATMAGPDHVIAAGSRFVQGLERKIVVYVQTSKPVYDDEDWGRLFAMSRCTSQLIWVKP